MVKQITPAEEEPQDPLSRFSRWWSHTIGGEEDQKNQNPDEGRTAADEDPDGPPTVESDQYVPKTESEDFYVPPKTQIEKRKIVSSRADNLDVDAPVRVLASSDKCGVGITFSIDEDNVLKVLHCVEGKPAARSGMVHKGDILEVVDGVSVIGHPMEVVHSILKGREVMSPAAIKIPKLLNAAKMPDTILLVAFGTGGMCSSLQGTVARLVLRDGSTGEEVSVALVREEVPAMSHYTVPEKVGVGITFETSAVDGSAVVKGVVRGSPADRSGLVRHGDVLYEVDGSNVFREGLDVVSNFLLGEQGTPVQMLFLRGTRIFVQLTLVREHTSRQSEMGDILLFAQSSRRIVPSGTAPGEAPRPHADSELNNREPVTLHGR